MSGKSEHIKFWYLIAGMVLLFADAWIIKAWIVGMPAYIPAYDVALHVVLGLLIILIGSFGVGQLLIAFGK